MHLVRNFILSTTEQFFNKPNLQIDGKENEALSEFINNSQSHFIQSYVHDDDKIGFNSQIQTYKEKCLIFYKTKTQQIQDSDGAISLDNINVITLTNNAAESLYHTLKHVYSPLLTAENDVYSIKLQKNLSDLESLLKTLTHGKGASNNVNIIFNIQDEIDYWKLIGQKKDVNKKEKEAVTTFSDLFQEILEEISILQSSKISEMRESAENIGALLDDVWRFTSVPYSQHRMIHIFDIIGHCICSLLQKTFSSADLWKTDSETKEYEILALLSDGLKVVQTWTSACRTLTETYWPNYSLHPWNGKPYVPLFCQKFEARLKEVLNIRSTHSQLSKLLSNNEAAQLNTNALFLPFQSINIWMCNGPNAPWEAAVAKFSASLRPAEVKIAEKLKPRLHNHSTKQMLYEFMRYRALIERPLVKQTLNNEMQMFVSSLLEMLKNIQNQMDSEQVSAEMYQPPEMSPTVHQIQWAKQAEAKVKEVQTCAEKYLKEFDGSSQLLVLATQVLKELKAMYTQLHEEWCRNLQAEAKSGLLHLASNKPVVEFSSESKMMEVMFNPRLVWLELEARALAALGLPAPPAAAALDSIAAALKQARALQQVASFHNTLGERMIPATRPLMLAAALELSALVQDQQAVYWDDNEQLHNYTDKLKKAVMKLEAQNSYLTNQHASIRNIVEKLMDTELLAKQSEWKKGVNDIRAIIEKVEASGHRSTELWRAHWDWQLYKALECQYIKTLLSLHKHFPHVKVDLVLRGERVRVQPPAEELRARHYQQLRRLVALPAHFAGLRGPPDGGASIFTDIVHKHSWLGNKAVKQLEAALSSLEQACAAWTRRAALACVPDLEALCLEHLREPADWELNFKACKAYGQAIAKMTFEDEKIHWISVGTTALRRELEAQTRSLWACLISSLQTSCRTDAAELEAFMANAAVMLESRALPKNAKELAEISAKQQALQMKMPEMEKRIEDLKKKGHMLRTWGGDASVDGTVKEWQKIRELMLSHQQMFEHQADLVKSSLKGEWENLNTAIDAWFSRWSQSRSRYEETHNVDYAEMSARCRSVFDAREQWNKFLADKADLIKECEKFNMSTELSESWQQAEKLINGYVDLWTVFKDYSEELEAMSQQEWLIFQKKLHLLDEFTTKWKGLLEPYTSVTLFIQQELEKYSDLPIVLKYVRGSEFTERHWREVLGLLQIAHKPAEALLLGDLLAVHTHLKKHLKCLQKICSSASSESAIRSALTELEIWFAGARLALVYYSDKAGRQTPIVKDFKEILNKIEEQQWVVSSLSGGEACGAWEARLRSARQLVRATHHAQRRSVPYLLLIVN